jgi:opacity protein-like surface antigen
MRQTPLLLFLLFPFALFSQEQQQPEGKKPPRPEHHSIGIGIKAGFNFANVTNASQINGSNRAGFHAGIFLAPPTHGIIGSRTELIYSRHGYNYKNDTINGSVNLDYIMLAQMMAIHITKYFEIQLGGQTAYLLHAKADSSRPSTGNANVDKLINYYNRFDYGFGAGVEIHPVAGLLIGARYCLSLSNLYKQSYTYDAGTGAPSFAPPSINLKNNVILISVGYCF